MTAPTSRRDNRTVKDYIRTILDFPHEGIKFRDVTTLFADARGFRIAVETNGTLPLPPGLDWICVSPKGHNRLVVTAGDELKLVYPQPGVDPADFERLDFRHFFLQPMDGPARAENTRAAIAYCLAHPRWRLSLQTHKFLGIP